MQLIISSNKEFRFLLWVFDLFTKYAWVIFLKNQKGITVITNAFQKILDESNRKPNKVWAAWGSEFYNRSMKSWQKKNAIEMYSVHKGGKSVVAESFIRNLKNKSYKYMNFNIKKCLH